MTVRKRTKRKAPKWNRRRTHPIQVYLTGSELVTLQGILRKRGLRVSELVRVWIRRAAAAGENAPRIASVAHEDPRQLRLV